MIFLQTWNKYEGGDILITIIDKIRLSLLKIHFLPLLFSIFVLFLAPAYAEVLNVSSDESEYFDGDTIKISGKVKFDPDIPSVIIQILTPAKDNFASIANAIPNSDGSFSTTFHAGGPTWPADGTYTVRVSYGGTDEISLKYAKSSPEKSTSAEEPNTPTKQSEIISNEQPEKTTSPTISEEANQKPKTHIPGFPALDKSPQYYIDRYNNEPDYKDWFNSQFPQQSIYQVLGFPEPVQVPNWIKITAEWWSTEKIRDADFLDGIEFMIKNNIMVIPYLEPPESIPNQDVPDWIRNTASWLAQDKISEEEFLNAIQFLIQAGIIVV